MNSGNRSCNQPVRCNAILTPNDLSYQCELQAGHLECEHRSWRFTWADVDRHKIGDRYGHAEHMGK